VTSAISRSTEANDKASGRFPVGTENVESFPVNDAEFVVRDWYDGLASREEKPDARNI